MGINVEDPRLVEFDVRTDEMLVNMGPQHPSTHGVLRVILEMDGEVITKSTPVMGYLHRGIEKIAPDDVNGCQKHHSHDQKGTYKCG